MNMTYFELVNACLLELNYKQVASFKDLYKSDHKRILENLNRVNFEVCSSFDWLFLQQKERVNLARGAFEVSNPCEGKIKSLMLNGRKLNYIADYEEFLKPRKKGSNTLSGCYSCFEDKILLPTQHKEGVLDVYYVSNNYAVDSDGCPKAKMQQASDESVIPMPYSEHILVYGACMKLKGNPEHNKFKFWYSLFTQAVANLRSRALYSAEECPKVRLLRAF